MPYSHDKWGNPNRRDCTCKNKECKKKNGKVVWWMDWEESETHQCPECKTLHCPSCLRKLVTKGVDFSSSSGSGYMGNWYTLTCLHCGWGVEDAEW